MQSLFEYEAHPRDPKEIFEYRFHDIGEKIPDGTFAHDLFFGIIENLDEVKKLIALYAPEWPVDKIDAVERAILYLGIYELVYTNDAPVPVVINECIELAKQYADENSNKFVNGVLNAVSEKEKKRCEVKKPKEEKVEKNEKGK